MGDNIFNNYFDELYDDYGKDESISPLNDDYCKSLAHDILKSKNICILTGAGISVSAGIPDFRSNEGIWKKYDPSVYGSMIGFLAHPQHFWKMGMELHSSITDKYPTKTHSALTKLQRMGKLQHIITQNVDGLHQMSGSENVYEVHGTTRRCRCIECGYTVDSEDVLANNEQPWINIPHCPQCNNLIKWDVVLFGEELQKTLYEETSQIIKNCDLLLIIGSSLEVNPINTFPLLAQMNRAKVAIVNKTETKHDDICDYVIRGESDTLIPKIVNYVEEYSQKSWLNTLLLPVGYAKKTYSFLKEIVCGAVSISMKHVEMIVDEVKAKYDAAYRESYKK